jgi:hypothetical protein
VEFDPEAVPTPEPVVTFRGNNYDLLGLVGVTIGGVALLSCATCNMGIYCLPILPIVMGAIGLAAAKDSVDPDRTRLLSWLSIGSGGIVLLIILLFVIAYVGFIAFAITTEGSSGF